MLRCSAMHIWRTVLPLIMMGMSLGCSGEDQPPGAQPGDGGASAKGAAETLSANALLESKDLKSFRPDRAKEDILKEVQWRGNFEMSSPYKDGTATAISYSLFASILDDPSGTSVVAVFIDEKFEKFVQFPGWEAVERIRDGETVRVAKPMKVGDFSWLIKAVESDPVDVAELEKEWKSDEPTPSNVDPGLTATFLLLGPALSAQHEAQLRKNTPLRDQFNAAQLKMGFTVRDVERTFRAKPLESGAVGPYNYSIYGSNELFGHLNEEVHFSNVLVLFREEKVTGIYSGWTVPAGFEWRQKLSELFSDLPEAKMNRALEK